MARRRYISSDMSADAEIAELTVHGLLPLLLYTWAIPHMDDWGRMTGEARQFKLLVCPAFDVTVSQVEDALQQITQHGLWFRYEIEGKKYIAIPKSKWFKYQSYINKNKRENDKQSTFPRPPMDLDWGKIPQSTEEHQKVNEEVNDNTEEEQETPQNTVSPSQDIKGDIYKWITQYKIKCRGVFDLEKAYSFIGVIDDDLIELCMKKSEGKSIAYFETIAKNIIADGITTFEAWKSQNSVKPKEGGRLDFLNDL